ncbi:hypothetical protein [uncultured Sulfitobacter sp.]|uniref:hypothetical protein n=1 Tax=uncultured Sulfitobacter sp. TaxID=191468 RepID=UPI00260C9EEE|nr:hypothetical protein [uncultured Sulfitobacter sp.]
MNGSLHIKIYQALLALVTLALLSLPFAHRAGAAPVTPEMSEYLALGGALSDICGDLGMPIAGGCESCNIVASASLPAAVYLSGYVLHWTAAQFDNLATVQTPDAAPYALPPARAPPVL